jgi:hypothetical protein
MNLDLNWNYRFIGFIQAKLITNSIELGAGSLRLH